MCYSFHESQILVCFALRPAAFKMQAILRQVAEWTKNDLENYKVKFTLYMYY